MSRGQQNRNPNASAAPSANTPANTNANNTSASAKTADNRRPGVISAAATLKALGVPEGCVVRKVSGLGYVAMPGSMNPALVTEEAIGTSSDLWVIADAQIDQALGLGATPPAPPPVPSDSAPPVPPVPYTPTVDTAPPSSPSDNGQAASDAKTDAPTNTEAKNEVEPSEKNKPAA